MVKVNKVDLVASVEKGLTEDLVDSVEKDLMEDPVDSVVNDHMEDSVDSVAKDRTEDSADSVAKDHTEDQVTKAAQEIPKPIQPVQLAPLKLPQPLPKSIMCNHPNQDNILFLNSIYC